MKVVEIREESELRGMKSAWDALLGDSASNTIFLTWEWVTAWWGAYGEPGTLRILAAIDTEGVVQGIAPLRSEPARKYGQAFPALRFVGDGSNDSDYLDCIVSASHEREVSEAFRGYWREPLRGGTLLMLNEVPETSPNLPWLRDLASAGKTIRTESDVPCGTVKLPRTWEDYLAMLKPRFRTKVRSGLRNLENRPEVQFGFCETLEQARNLLPVLFDLHTRRWLQNGKPGVFGWDKKRDFYSKLSATLLDRGWLRFSWLKWNGQVLACQYGFSYSGTYSQLQEGYEPAAEHWNPGIGLRAWSIREFIQQGLGEYDFLGGVGRHKTDWAAEVKHSKKILIAGDTWKNRVFLNGPEWEERGRELARRLVPEKVLAARRDRIEREILAAAQPSRNGHTSESAGDGWLREAAANCYFYSPLPRLMRPLRNRYRLSVGSNGNGRKVSWSRRTETSARILYYHRVNDDHDPFFAAISTDLFDRQMRYVARHYKNVVSMSQLLEHLESGSTETVLAVTFDDGYRDNYHNAFPILQRYGLPATIFLTTGSIDTGEPLWFEVLALALKTTTREFVDLDIDIPRRVWIRTEAERLAANGSIFAILRTLPDSDRRQWLDQILRQLGAGNDGARKDKMLTWDQVRLMKAQGIDFGGHTVTHPFISKLTREQVMSEVSGCKRRIEDELQLPVEYFAYPNGREEDFGVWNKELIRAAGYRAAVTTIWGTNYRSTDLMALRRGGPWEPSVPLFAYKLDWYQLIDD
jgi:peptidoglycan/xylan/chitin deacetylase (PgdA/CDA1 family)/CelD/BcsL family acetyltransferase involved in cellulose biosynthesis